MSMIETFETAEDEHNEALFLKNGYVIADVAHRPMLIEFRNEIVRIICIELGCPMPDDPEAFLNSFHDRMEPENINALRLAVYNGINRQPWCRPSYYHLAKPLLDSLIGNELAMQNKVNLSIQMPDDATSVLPAHSDVWSAETPFEAVMWLPLVDAFETKAMFLLPPEANREVRARVNAHGNTPAKFDLYAEFKDQFKFIAVPFGKALIFSPILLHGNILNETEETRWSLNCRFTGLFSPYSSSDKTLGNFYLPISPKPVSRVGMAFKAPGNFDA
jgi:sporadic carbohydrate cluster 2OG-Fe(II) oxygenase